MRIVRKILIGAAGLLSYGLVTISCDTADIDIVDGYESPMGDVAQPVSNLDVVASRVIAEPLAVDEEVRNFIIHWLSTESSAGAPVTDLQFQVTNNTSFKGRFSVVLQLQGLGLRHSLEVGETVLFPGMSERFAVSAADLPIQVTQDWGAVTVELYAQNDHSKDARQLLEVTTPARFQHGPDFLTVKLLSEVDFIHYSNQMAAELALHSGDQVFSVASLQKFLVGRALNSSGELQSVTADRVAEYQHSLTPSFVKLTVSEADIQNLPGKDGGL